MSSNQPLIFDALRTPRGMGRAVSENKTGGSLAERPPHQLVVQLIDALKRRHAGLLEHINSLTLGCVGQIGAQGGHLALVSRLASGLADQVTVKTLNNYCASGLTAINDAAKSLLAGDPGLHLAGGVESLSSVAFLGDQASYYCDPVLAKQLRWAPPVMGAELIATLQGYNKAELDNISLQSHLKAQTAWDKGYYDASVIPITHDSGAVALARDELIRGNLNIDKLAAMAPAFSRQGAAGFDAMMLAEYPQLDAINHVHSIANCPGMADGAALVVVGDHASGARAGLSPKARILAMAETAGDPILQLTAGLDAVDEVLRKTHLSIKDFDRIEFMEAFAAPTLKFLQDYRPDIDKVNVNGGHIAMGHPMGASGAILLTTLVHELHRCDGSLGLVVTQAAGGIGCAMIIERM